ncbi:MAG: caspase family protein [Pseudomonadota bacterium]
MTALVAEAFSGSAAGRIGSSARGPTAWGAKLLSLLAVLALIALLLHLLPADAEEAAPLKGIALVIGEANYKHLDALTNPDDDARNIKRLLDDLGFDARDVVNRDGKTLKRDLDRFVEDAAGADVALIYYSGHGIEAGGENWLIPIDADLSSLDKAEERLVPLSAYLEKLQQTAPLTIILLDACRSSPFPPGASLRRAPSASPAPVAAQGLAAPTKGITVIEPAEPALAGIGSATLLGFAAAPGQLALDGAKDAGSPYARALLRHLASRGLSFGDVMTLVSQEVYVETQGRQLPWTNHNLRQFLYFGMTAAADDGDKATISAERRGLLLTIAALPEDRKRLVEGVARSDQVPLAALYGMLGQLDIAGGGDAAALDKRLREGSEKLKSFLAERQTLRSADSELTRLSALANEALDQGAIKAAIGFHEKAKARIAALAATVDQSKADVKARELEFAQAFAQSAETNLLAFDYGKAAADYGAAADRAETWDKKLAFTYRLAAAGALTSQGSSQGDKAAGDQAIAAYEALLAGLSRELAPLDWARVQTALGTALATLGADDKTPDRLKKSLIAFEAALTERTREKTPLAWAETQRQRGNALARLGERTRGTARLEEAVATYQTALEVLDRDRTPLAWARTQSRLGDVLLTIGERNDPTQLYAAMQAHRRAMEVMTRERMPLDWAVGMKNLGDALQYLALGETGLDRLDEAAAAYEEALTEITRARMPLAWAVIQNNLGNVQAMLGERGENAAELEQALGNYRNALEIWTRESLPLKWASTQTNIGTVLQSLGARESGTTRLKEAEAIYRAALLELPAENAPRDRAFAEQNLAITLLTIGRRENAKERIAEAKAAMQRARDLYRAAGDDRYDGYFDDQITQIEAELGKSAP